MPLYIPVLVYLEAYFFASPCLSPLIFSYPSFPTYYIDHHALNFVYFIPSPDREGEVFIHALTGSQKVSSLSNATFKKKTFSIGTRQVRIKPTGGRDSIEREGKKGRAGRERETERDLKLTHDHQIHSTHKTPIMTSCVCISTGRCYMSRELTIGR